MNLSRCRRVVMAAAVSLLAPVELASQDTGEKSPRRAQFLSAAGTVVPIAAGAVVLAIRPRGGPEGPADETWDAVGGVLIGLGLGVGPSLGHFYAHQMGWFLPRVLVGGALGLAAASSDLDNGAPLALVGLTVVTVMAIRDIATASEAARRYNARQLGLVFDLVPGSEEGRLSLRLGVAAEL